MAYVVINALTVPSGAHETLEARFSARKHAVDSAPGFQHFELLRPAAGIEQYLVYTRWDDQQSYQAWLDSQDFAGSHGSSRPAATGSQIWEFETALGD